MPLCTELYHTIGREYIVKNIAYFSQPGPSYGQSYRVLDYA